MFSKPTVLILGAGASAPFGYPLGQNLIENIVKGLQSLPSDRYYDMSGPISSRPDLLNSPYRALVDYVFTRRPDFLPPEFVSKVRPWRKLAEELHHTSHQSIDDYARLNPSHGKVVKLLIALEVGRISYEPNSLKNNELRASPRLTANSRASWYGKLVHKIRQNCSNSDECQSKNNLTILTFNYDRSLEMYLERELRRAELFHDVDWKKVVGVVHMHGELAVGEAKIGTHLSANYAQSLIDSAANMKMFDDPRHEQDPALFARYFLDKASAIYVFGFDFHDQNVELLNLSDSKIANKMMVLNYANSHGLRSRALQAGVSEQKIWHASGNYEIAQAIDDGIFDV
jgi:hypothetical protein